MYIHVPIYILLVCLDETLEEISLLSEAGEELINLIRESYLDAEFETKWRPAKIQLIHNKSLQVAYGGMYAVFVFRSGHFIKLTFDCLMQHAEGIFVEQISSFQTSSRQTSV